VRQEALDTLVWAETPEGILLELRPAGLAIRAAAFLVDLLIRLVLFIALLAALLRLEGLGTAVLLVLVFALEWLYPVPFELSRWGGTPGKRLLGLKVVMDSGLPVTPAASFTRNLLRVADFLPLLYGSGLLSMLLRPDFKRLGDLAAATLVVHRPPPVPKFPASNVPPLAPAIPVSPENQAAVIALAARARRLTPARLNELAALAAAVSGDAGRSGEDVTRRVLGVAQWFLGRRASPAQGAGPVQNAPLAQPVGERP
jgi:uncharacterized RDD family membrane protein YckC